MQYDGDGTAGRETDAATDPAEVSAGRRILQYDASKGSDPQHQADVAWFWLTVKVWSLGSV